MVSNVTINVGVDDSSAQATLAQLQTKIDAQQVAWAERRSEANIAVDALKAKIDAQQREWEIKRQQILAEMRDVSMGINQLFTSIRLVVSIAGEAIDPIYSALMSIISGTVSLMLATATAITAGSFGILGWIGLALAAAAIGLQVGQTAKLLIERQMVENRLSTVEGKLARYGGLTGGGFL